MINKLNNYIDLLEFFASNKWQSPSQLVQDLLVMYFTNFKKNGFFVEIGAADGFFLSNTLLLENIGWRGIIAEPLPRRHEKIKERKCRIDLRCIYNKSNLKLMFDNIIDNPELSGVSMDLDSNYKNINKIEVNTVSLNDLLEEHEAPNYIDYISVDTEGSEFKILQEFNFQRYQVEIFTIEHNFVEKKRNEIFELMSLNSYIRVFEKISRWDDWYIKKNNSILQSFF